MSIILVPWSPKTLALYTLMVYETASINLYNWNFFLAVNIYVNKMKKVND